MRTSESFESTVNSGNWAPSDCGDTSSPIPEIDSSIDDFAQDEFSKFPSGSTVTKLNSTLEIKQAWLYSEWATECQFSQHIRPNFPDRRGLRPTNIRPNIELIESTF